MRRRGAFIVLEGPDKSGKSTQASLLKRRLMERGLEVLHTREPGGTVLAEEVRRLLLNPELRVTPLTELLLYEASRAQHTDETIRPALDAGKVVLSERYTMATEAYQGHGRGLPLGLIGRLNRIATGGLEPDLTLVLDIPDAEFGARDPSRAHDRLENESSAFRRRVREGYRKLAKGRPRTVLLDGRRPLEQLQAEIARRVEKVLAR